jgi:hypothetical protein
VEETPARLPLPTQLNRLPRAGHPPHRRQGPGTQRRHEPPTEGPYPLSTGRACTPRPVEPPVASRLRSKAFDLPLWGTAPLGGLTQQQAPRSFKEATRRFQEALREISISNPGTLLRRRTHTGAGVAPINSNPRTLVACGRLTAAVPSPQPRNSTPRTPGPLPAAHPPQAGREFQPKDHTALSTSTTPGMQAGVPVRTNLPYVTLTGVRRVRRDIRDQCEHAGQNSNPTTPPAPALRPHTTGGAGADNSTPSTLCGRHIAAGSAGPLQPIQRPCSVTPANRTADLRPAHRSQASHWRTARPPNYKPNSTSMLPVPQQTAWDAPRHRRSPCLNPST